MINTIRHLTSKICTVFECYHDLFLFDRIYLVHLGSALISWGMNAEETR